MCLRRFDINFKKGEQVDKFKKCRPKKITFFADMSAKGSNLVLSNVFFCGGYKML